jgi:hypothetical protein
MSLASRLKKLEIKLLSTRLEIYWIMWRDCQWNECEGLVRNPNESIEDFKIRVLSVSDKKFLWVR